MELNPNSGWLGGLTHSCLLGETTNYEGRGGGERDSQDHQGYRFSLIHRMTSPRINFLAVDFPLQLCPLDS